MRKIARTLVTGTMVAAVAAGATACGSSDTSSSGSTSAGSASTATKGGGRKIALLLPENKTTRYEAHDRPNFIARVKELCPNCEVLYQNAAQDPSKQQAQAEAALTNGADAIVLDAVDAGSATAIVNRAKQSNVPVIAYDRLITGAPIDSYVSFDNVRVGQTQAQALVDALGPSARGRSIVMINGAPTDHSAGEYKRGAHDVIDKSGLKVGKEYDTPDWSPDKAQNQMMQAVTALGKNGFVGVYAANDGTAGGAIAAMKSTGVDPKTRPTTGQDAEVAGVQRVVTGDQQMTIYLRIGDQANASAELAVAAVEGRAPPAGLINAEVDNGTGRRIPSVLLPPVAVTRANVRDTVVKDGFLRVSEICTAPIAAACARAGLK
jgi:D-xylose transport system substrate-binding protein